MSFANLIEALIKEAQERGQFDNLPGKGKPIDLTDYFNTPEDIRVAQSVLKNAGMIPAEVDLLQEIAILNETLKTMKDNTEIKKLHKMLKDKQLQLNLLLERRKR